jgi:hypothetical protein
LDDIEISFEAIKSLVAEVFEGMKYQLIPYGSSTNGLAIKGEYDLDLSLVLNEPYDIEMNLKNQYLTFDV